MGIGRLLVSVVLAACLLAATAFAGEISAMGRKDHFTGAVITDARFAVAVVKQDETLYFADISAAMKWRAGECIGVVTFCDAQTWAFDYYTSEPVPLKAAYFVIAPWVKTPKDSGITAFRDEASAKRLMGENPGAKGPLDFDQLASMFN